MYVYFSQESRFFPEKWKKKKTEFFLGGRKNRAPTKVLTEEYGRNMEGFAKTFSVVVGEDGGVAGFAGTLCDMARINSGDSDLAKELGIDSAEEAAENTTT